MSTISRNSARALSTAILAMVFSILLSTACMGVSPAELPPSLRALPMDVLLSLFSVSFETPNVAAEVARMRAWAPATKKDIENCPALAKVIVDYPRTSDARRALLDIAGVYARMGEWDAAEAPFRYVMETRSGQPEARIARFRLAELYRYAGESAGKDAIAECRSGIEACVETPEEGLGRMLLADLLAEQDQDEQSFTEFERVLQEYPGQSYSSYARIRYTLALADKGRYDRAKEVIAPVLDDPVWGGRAHYARGRANGAQQDMEAATADYVAAARTADSIFIRGQAYKELACLAAGKGDFLRAQSYLQSGLAIVPYDSDRLDMRLELMRYLSASGQYVGAATYAVELIIEVMHQQGRYPEHRVANAVRLCNEVLDRCEAGLAEEAGHSLAQDRQQEKQP